MARVNVIDQSGVERSFDAEPGLTLMENLRDNGFDAIVALCGGVMACATCQVYLDADTHRAAGDPDEAEIELLDGSGVREPTSRLSCQIQMTDQTGEIRLRIAPLL